MNYDSNLPLSAPSALNQSPDLSFVRQELQHLVRSFINSSDQRFGVIAVTPGGGKTYSTSKVLVEVCNQNPNFIAFLAQNTKNRINEEAENIRDQFDYQTTIIHGRTDDLNSPGYCQNYQEANRIGLSGHSTKALLCQSLCQFKEQCENSGYLSQFNDHQAGGYYLAPYESSILWATHHGTPDLIVFDENPMRLSNLKFEFNAEDLFKFRQKIEHLVNFSEHQHDFLFTFLSAIERLISTHGRSKDTFDYKRGIEVRNSFYSCMQKNCGDRGLISIFNPELEWENEILALRNKWRLELETCIENSARITNTNYLLSTTILDVFKCLTYSPSHLEITLKKKSNQSSLQINKFRDVIQEIPEQTKVLILDAYADKDTYQHLLNTDEIHYFKYPIGDYLETVQIPKNTSQTKMIKLEDEDLKNLLSWFFTDFKHQSLLIYSHKDEIEPYPDQAGRLKNLVEKIKPENLEIKYSWFHTNRGTNDYTDLESVMIFGQACPNPNELISELNARYNDYISNERLKNSQYQDDRFYRGLVEKQHHEILQCIHRIRPINSPKTAYLFYSDSIEIEGLEIDQVINYQQLAKNLITPERMKEFEVYSSLVESVVDEIGFYAIKFQSDLVLMKVLIKNQKLIEKMEWLISSSQYGKSFSRNNGKRIRGQLAEIISNLKLSESKLKIYQQGVYSKTIKTLGSESNKVYRLELTTGEIY